MSLWIHIRGDLYQCQMKCERRSASCNRDVAGRQVLGRSRCPCSVLFETSYSAMCIRLSRGNTTTTYNGHNEPYPREHVYFKLPAPRLLAAIVQSVLVCSAIRVQLYVELANLPCCYQKDACDSTYLKLTFFYTFHGQYQFAVIPDGGLLCFSDSA